MKTIHMDMDGVIVNLTAAVLKATGYRWGEISSTKMWKKLKLETPDLFLIAEPMPDARVLVDGVLKYADEHDMVVEILTAVPLMVTFPAAGDDKYKWLERHFPELAAKKFKTGPRAPDKCKHAVVGDILIDDSPLNIRDWARVGGISIFHKSAKESLARLHTSGYRRMKHYGS